MLMPGPAPPPRPPPPQYHPKWEESVRQGSVFLRGGGGVTAISDARVRVSGASTAPGKSHARPCPGALRPPAGTAPRGKGQLGGPPLWGGVLGSQVVLDSWPKQGNPGLWHFLDGAGTVSWMGKDT